MDRLIEPKQLIELQCSLCDEYTGELGIKGDYGLCLECRERLSKSASRAESKAIIRSIEGR